MLKVFAKSIFYRFLGDGAFFVIQLATMMFLSRILTPEDFGVAAVVMLIYNFLNVFNDAGLKNIIFQRINDTQLDYRKVLGLSVALGVFLCLIMFIISPLSVFVFSDSRVPAASFITSLAFIFQSFSRISSAILEKNFKFGKVSLVYTISASFSGIIAVVMALLGCGYWSLIAMLLIKSFFDMLVLAYMANMWIPIFSFEFSKQYFGFSYYITGHNLMLYFSGNIEKFFIGSFFTTSLLGIYTRAFTLLSVYERLVPSILVQVMYPLFGRMRDRMGDVEKIYYTILKLVFIFGGVSMAIVGVWAKEFNLIIWGGQWQEATLSLSILSFSAIAFTQLLMSRMVFITFYAENKIIQFSGLYAIASILFCAIGVPWGMNGVVCGYASAAWVCAIIFGVYVGTNLIKNSLGIFTKIFAQGVFLSVIFATLAFALKFLLAHFAIYGILALFIGLLVEIPIMLAYFYFFEKKSLLEIKKLIGNDKL